MPSGYHSLTALEARKKLLVLEADIHRLRLKADGRELLDHTAAVVESVRSHLVKAAAVASTVAVAAGAFKAVSAFASRSKPGEKEAPPHKPSMLSKVFSAARLGATMWAAFKSNKNNGDHRE
jgi:hypothetical protein